MDVVRTRESDMGSPDCGAIGPNEACRVEFIWAGFNAM